MATAEKKLNRARKPRQGLLELNLRSLLLWTTLLKACVIAVIYLGYSFFPFNLPNYRANFIYPPGEAPDLWTPLKTWDGQIYLSLADQGYHPHEFTNAFYPLFPFLVRIAGLAAGGNNLMGGLLFSHFLTFLAVSYLYRMARENYGERGAFYGCLFLLAFPTGFFLGLLYSESLFLALAAGYFYYWGQKKTGPTAFCAFLLPLSRPTGILVLLPALIAALDARQRARPWVSKWLPVAGLLVGYAAYFGWMRMMTGDAFAAFEAEKSFIAYFDIKNLFHPLDWFFQTFLKLDPSLPFTPILLLNRVFFVLFLWALWASRDFLTRPFFAYCLVLGLVPALSGAMVTYLRYLLVLFPLFPALALRCKGKEGYYLTVSLVLQAYLAVQYALNYFVA